MVGGEERLRFRRRHCLCTRSLIPTSPRASLAAHSEQLGETTLYRGSYNGVVDFRLARAHEGKTSLLIDQRRRWTGVHWRASPCS
jgi:hypothetical protein